MLLPCVAHRPAFVVGLIQVCVKSRRLAMLQLLETPKAGSVASVVHLCEASKAGYYSYMKRHRLAVTTT